ncbi:receptor-like kinase Rhg4, putative [Medicago truncatula]|uniref:Receptor-like kinase Rhg4, putative n=1 Tax=Medicago truncatula TaxID=3880 RepID=G7KX90_MEDTR|nr:receptor-like kinase Rhg4, putative [Medicago truncatula]
MKIDIVTSMKFFSRSWLNKIRFASSIQVSFNSTYLFDLHLELNFLIDLIPPSLLTLPNLKNISLDHNFLQGPVSM